MGWFSSVISTITRAVSNPSTFFAAFNPISFIATIAMNMAVSYALNKFFGPKKKSAQPQSFQQESSDRHVVARGGVESRRVLYGEMVTSGPLIFAGSTGSNNKFLHMVVALANHEVEAIETVYLNDKEITVSQLNSAGLVTAGTFANKVRIKKALGSATQAADSDLVSEVTNWTSAHQLKGIAYLYVRLEHDTKLFPTGIPNLKAVVRGKKILDTRDGVTRWTNNPALIIRDYLSSTDGLSCDDAEINDTSVTAAANVSDEFVTTTAVVDTFTAATTDTCTRATSGIRYHRGDRVQISTTGSLPGGLSGSTNYYYIPYDGYESKKFKLALTYANSLAGTVIDITSAGSGTHTITSNAQPRYTNDGTFKLDASPIEVVDDLVVGMAGAVVYSKGAYSIFAGEATSSSKSIDEDVLTGVITVRPHIERSELFNHVRGTYVDPYNKWQSSDFPILTNSGYSSADGEDLYRDIELPFTTNSIRAQRIAKIMLEKSRQGITCEMDCNYSLMNVAVFDVISVTNARLGWSAKQFRVMSWQFTPTGGINLLLQEEASTVYDWSAGNETTIDSAPDTTLADPLSVDPPTLAVSDSLVLYNAGTVIVKLGITLTPPSTAFTETYQVESRISTDPSYSIIGAGTATTFELLNVLSGKNYDIRAKTINSLGVESDYETVQHFVVGEIEPPSSVADFAINIIGGQALLTWTAVPDLDLEYYIIRFSNATTGADWNNSVDLVSQVARPATSVTVPAMVGSYLIKARDKSGHESSTEAVIVSTIAGISGQNVVANEYEHPAFSGVRSSTVLLDGGLQLSSSVLFESTTGNFDSAAGYFDGGGQATSVLSSGTYLFDNRVDLGATYTPRLTAAITQSISDRHSIFDEAAGLFDARAGSFDGDEASQATSSLQIATTTDDPNGGSATFSDFRNFVVGDYTARGFKFRLQMTSGNNKVSPKITALSVNASFPDKTNSAADIVSGTSTKTVTYPSPFKITTPAIGISGQGMAAGDGFSVSTKTATSFNINFFNSSGGAVSRTFDYIARGY